MEKTELERKTEILHLTMWGSLKEIDHLLNVQRYEIRGLKYLAKENLDKALKFAEDNVEIIKEYYKKFIEKEVE